MNNENNITFKLNSEIKYVEDDMFRDLKKREAKRNNPVTESFKEITDAIENNKIEIGGTGLPIDRYMYMENESNSFSGQDEMIEQGTEKLMDMPMNEMKEFISSKPEEDEKSNESTDVIEKGPAPPEDLEDSNESNDEGTASDSGEDDKTVDNSVDNSTDSTDTEAGIDSDERLKSFGQDNSDVQNEYNTKDVDILNKLIASESEAINDYFDGAKDCNNETLRRLYGDIGHEERFHLEQLLYAKSTLTGERYEPRDPDVKHEYEELLKMGMDEETAASTAIDKTTINESIDKNVDMDKLAQEAAMIESMLNQNAILTEFCCDLMQNTLKRNVSMTHSARILMESFIQEEVTNVAQAPKEIKELPSPLKLLYRGLKASINGLIKLSEHVRDASAKNLIKYHQKKEWLNKHGIRDLFKSGIQLYFYNDKESRYDINEPCRYVNLLYQLTKAIAKQGGIKLTQEAKHGNVKNPLHFSNISQGINALKQTVLTKTKVIVTDANEKALIKEFFGYTDQKMNKISVKYDGSDQTVNPSANIYNRIDAMLSITKEYVAISEGVLVELQKYEGDTGSIYYKNRKLYNELVNDIKIVVDYYNKFIACIAHDLKVIFSFDNGLLKITREREQTEQAGGTWEGPDIKSDGNMTQSTPNKYAKQKKRFFGK